MKCKRLLTVCLSLLLICSLIIGVSPIRAKANAGLVAAEIVKFATVTVNPYVLAGAALICLGAMAASDPQPFIDGATLIADTIGDVGSTVYRAVTDAGKSIYYVTAEYLESVRCAAIDSGIIYNQAEAFSAGDTITISNGDTLAVQQNCYKVQFVGYYSQSWTLYECVFSEPGENLTYYLNGSDTISQGTYHGGYRVYSYSRSVDSFTALGYPSIGVYGTDYTSSLWNRIIECYKNGLLGMTVADGFTCGLVPSVPIDGSSALKWSETYGNNQLRLIPSNNSGNAGGDQNNGFVENVLFPLHLLNSLADLAGVTQQEQWLGDSPPDALPDVAPDVEFEIISTPEIDGFQGIEVAPVVDPAPESPPNADPEIDPEGGTGSSVGWLNPLLNGLKSLLVKLFVPSESFFQTSVNNLLSKYPFLQYFTTLGDSLLSFFKGLGSKPPIIYIDLGAAEGSYAIGGKVAFIDLTWYSRYKPTMDAVLGGFLWLWFSWRLYLAAPGIISGVSGAVGSVHSYEKSQERSGRSKDT